MTVSHSTIEEVSMEFAHIVLIVLAIALAVKLGYLWYLKHHSGASQRSHHKDS
ncbi:hypothetical protein C8D85_3125 [Marinomonas communis]|uniref:Uncharacterized protein n=1 Tax=Marinomonas communis TaxID=28254 RepID=A0A4R6WYF9_9GAMM|nr:hypothetical protein C8D85_3125 [Marinomonas communis]